MEKSLKNLSVMSTDLFQECNVLFYPPAAMTELTEHCPIVTDFQKPCNDSGTLSNEKSYLVQACDAYHLPYTNCYISYKNMFCALCFTDTVNQLPIECNKDVGFSVDQFPKFSALINFDEKRKNDIKIPDENCGVGQVYDKLMVSRDVHNIVVLRNECIFLFVDGSIHPKKK
jgi:hypothetical protein